jgi:hypothetical protein
VSKHNTALWVGLAVLYFFMMPVAILVLVALYYMGKMQVSFKWKHYLMPALGLLAIATFFYGQAYMALRVTTLILFVLYFCGRFKMRMK